MKRKVSVSSLDSLEGGNGSSSSNTVTIFDEELEAMKNSSKWQEMDPTEKRRYRNMVLARRTRLRLRTEIDFLKNQAKVLEEENRKLKHEFQVNCANMCTATNIIANFYEVPDVVKQVMHEIAGTEDIEASAFCVLSAPSTQRTIVYATDGFLKLSGYRREEVIGQHGLFHCAQHRISISAPTVATAVKAEAKVQQEDAALALATEVDFQSLLLSYRKSGEQFQNLSQFTHLKDQMGRSFLVVAHYTEMINVRHFEETLSLCTSQPSGVSDPLLPCLIKEPSALCSIQHHHHQQQREEMVATMPAIDLSKPPTDAVNSNQSKTRPQPQLQSQSEINSDMKSDMLDLFTAPDIVDLLQMMPSSHSIDVAEPLNCPSFDFLGTVSCGSHSIKA